MEAELHEMSPRPSAFSQMTIDRQPENPFIYSVRFSSCFQGDDAVVCSPALAAASGSPLVFVFFVNPSTWRRPARTVSRPSHFNRPPSVLSIHEKVYYDPQLFVQMDH